MMFDLDGLKESASFLRAVGNHVDAAEAYRQILEHVPNDSEAWLQLGISNLHHGDLDAADSALQQARQLAPESAVIANACAVALLRLERWGEAAAACEAAIANDPKFGPAYYNLGEISRHLGKLPQAARFYSIAGELNPSDPAPIVQLADLHVASRDWPMVVRLLDAAEQLVINSSEVQLRAEIVGRRGVAKAEQQDFAAAVLDLRLAAELASRMPEVHANLSYVCERLGLYDEAIAAATEAIRLRPEAAQSWNNLGVALRSGFRIGDAVQAFERAMEIAPGFALAEFNLGTTHLLAGRYRDGWAGLERGIEMTGSRQLIREIPVWNGESLAASAGDVPQQDDSRNVGQPVTSRKKLLVVADQGLGDSLQFARFLPEIRRRAGVDVVCEVSNAAVDLLSRLYPGIKFEEHSTTEIDATRHDVCAQAAMTSLPRILDVEIDDVRSYPLPTIAADDLPRFAISSGEIESEAAADSSPNGTIVTERRPFRIAVAWRGNQHHANDGQRSMRLEQLAAVAAIPGVQLLVAQVDAAAREEFFSAPESIGLWCGDVLSNLLDTAGLLNQVDLVLTVDTALAHLAGTLGKETWVMLHRSADWRWQIEGESTPWYPTARLFRQRVAGDWASVVADVVAWLKDHMAAGDATDRSRSAA